MLLTGIGRDTHFSSWRLSRKEATNANFSKNEPDPTPQLLKSFVEDYIATRKKSTLLEVCLSEFH